MSNSIFTDAAEAALTVTVTSFEVAVARATVAASMILNFTFLIGSSHNGPSRVAH